MSKRPSFVLCVALAVAVAPSLAGAHSGGRLDPDGCHSDHRHHNYHCHVGPLRGHEFDSRAEMREVLESGDLPPPVDEPGFLDKLLRRDPEAEAAAPAAASEPAPGAAETQAAGSAAAVAPPENAASGERSFEERLRILKGLHELGLITDAEYESRRKAILAEL